jgi:hypothetical protein
MSFEKEIGHKNPDKYYMTYALHAKILTCVRHQAERNNCGRIRFELTKVLCL